MASQIDDFRFFSVPWDNVDSSVSQLPEDKKKRANQACNDMNKDLFMMRVNSWQPPKEYMEFAKRLVANNTQDAGWVKNRKNTEVTIAEETYILDRQKARTYYDINIAAQIFAPVTRPAGRYKWDAKHYLIQKQENASKFSREFDNPRMIQLKVSPQLDGGIGWYLGYRINRWALMENEGEFFDLQFETMLEASAQMGRTAHEHILTGTTIEHGGKSDAGAAGSTLAMTGLTNDASMQAFVMADPTVWLNIIKGLRLGLADLKKVFATGNVVMITTAGLVEQAESNYATYYNWTERDEIEKQLVGPNKPIKSWWTTDQLTGAAISNTTQKVVLIKLDPRLLNRILVLPLQTIPLLEKKYADDVAEIMVAGDILRYNLYDSVENAFPATAEDALTTAGVGYRTNGRVL